MWSLVFKSALDTRPGPKASYDKIRAYFFGSEFHWIFDLIELSGKIIFSDRNRYYLSCNLALARERAAFRFAGDQLVKVTDPAELEAIESAMTTGPAESARKHISRAAELYSDRASPDYRNSIKESISAVEAAVAFLSGKKSGGISKSLQEVLADQILHPALRQGFEKLYAYTSDAGGIRHALMEDGRTLTQEDARYMLVSCSAFVSYLFALSARS